MKNMNIIGRNIAKFRYQAGWTQEFLAAKMQLLGCYMSRSIIAKIETRRTAVTDKRIAFFAAVFDVSLDELFPIGPILNWPKDQ